MVASAEPEPATQPTKKKIGTWKKKKRVDTRNRKHMGTGRGKAHLLGCRIDAYEKHRAGKTFKKAELEEMIRKLKDKHRKLTAKHAKCSMKTARRE